MSSITHLRLGSTGNLPLFNTRGTERFETSSTLNTDHGAASSASADIFSFGVVLSELDSNLNPYAEARVTIPLLQLVAMNRVSVNISSNAPTELINLGRTCVSLNSKARPSASEVHYELQLILQTYEMYTV
ncbi:TKL protein kinase [Phytophthora megakarya]|uniref:TKL protein kinase n=1 Tax=Phytophthora megakarya TaxID=4795 RepID=A0A225UVG6_9STRA|nr:TKL protein kinase [Phytophthora megakarya]